MQRIGRTTNASTLGSLFAACCLAAAPGASLAGPHGGVGGGMSAGGMSGMHGDFGGMSSAHIGAQGLANSNGPGALDRDFGRDRAEDRMNSHAAHRVANSNGPNALDRDFGRDRAEDRTDLKGASRVATMSNGHKATVRLHGRARAAAVDSR